MLNLQCSSSFRILISSSTRYSSRLFRTWKEGKETFRFVSSWRTRAIFALSHLHFVLDAVEILCENVQVHLLQLRLEHEGVVADANEPKPVKRVGLDVSLLVGDEVEDRLEDFLDRIRPILLKKKNMHSCYRARHITGFTFNPE